MLRSWPVFRRSQHLCNVCSGDPQFTGVSSYGQNPLPLDVLVVDEASMIDLPMMARLLVALPPQARLILLGDKDQLASVKFAPCWAISASLLRRG